MKKLFLASISYTELKRRENEVMTPLAAPAPEVKRPRGRPRKQK